MADADTATAAEFRVLGPVGVWVGGVPAPVGGPRPRGLLAVLLLSRGRTVSARALVGALWGDDPPATVTGRVHAIVSELRGSLGTAGLDSRLIETRPGGYALDPAAGGFIVDLDVFAAHADAGRRAAEDRRHAEAAVHFRDALDSWTGSVLEGLDAPFVEREVARWEGQRLDVIEALAAARLEAPGPPDAGLISDLTGLVGRHPRREALVAHLMTALHRAGRVPEALDVYRANRRWLREELGLDAPKRLQALESAILRDEVQGPATLGGPQAVEHEDRSRGDHPGAGRAAGRGSGPATGSGPGPAAPPRRPTASGASRPWADGAPRPAQLPAGVAGFTGRDDELARIDALLAPPVRAGSGAPVVLVTGPAGVGKTALALSWAHRSAGDYPDGQLFANLRGHSAAPPVEPAEALGGFLRALGVASAAVPPDLDEAAALFRSLVARRRVLIVLDNAVSPSQVRPLLPGGSACRVLVTSRNRLSGLIAADGARSVALGALSAPDAIGLLGEILGGQRVRDESRDAFRLAERCGFLPLALRIAAARLVGAADLSIARFVRRLEEAGTLSTLTVDGDEQNSVVAALHLSYRALSPSARSVFRLLGVAAFDDFTPASVAALAPDGGTSAALDELVNAHLVERSAAGRYALHDLVAEYAAEHAAEELTEQQRRDAVGRIVGWYAATTGSGSLTIFPKAGDQRSFAGGLRFAAHDEAFAWFEGEHVNLVAATRGRRAQPPRDGRRTGPQPGLLLRPEQALGRLDRDPPDRRGVGPHARRPGGRGPHPQLHRRRLRPDPAVRGGLWPTAAGPRPDPRRRRRGLRGGGADQPGSDVCPGRRPGRVAGAH